MSWYFQYVGQNEMLMSLTHPFLFCFLLQKESGLKEQLKHNARIL